jgi:hypothetical protein
METRQDQPLPTMAAAVGGAPPAPELSDDMTMKTSEATPSVDARYSFTPGTMLSETISPFTQPIPGAVGNTGTTPIDAPTDSLGLGGSVSMPPMQESGTSSPDTFDLQQQQPLPDPLPTEASSAASVADESPALWLIFLVAALVGIGATIVVTRALRRVE